MTVKFTKTNEKWLPVSLSLLKAEKCSLKRNKVIHCRALLWWWDKINTILETVTQQAYSCGYIQQAGAELMWSLVSTLDCLQIQKFSFHLNKSSVQDGRNLRDWTVDPKLLTLLTDWTGWIYSSTFTVNLVANTNTANYQRNLGNENFWRSKTKAFIGGGNLDWILDFNPSSRPVSVYQEGSRTSVCVFFLYHFRCLTIIPQQRTSHLNIRSVFLWLASIIYWEPDSENSGNNPGCCLRMSVPTTT